MFSFTSLIWFPADFRSPSPLCISLQLLIVHDVATFCIISKFGHYTQGSPFLIIDVACEQLWLKHWHWAQPPNRKINHLLLLFFATTDSSVHTSCFQLRAISVFDNLLFNIILKIFWDTPLSAVLVANIKHDLWLTNPCWFCRKISFPTYSTLITDFPISVLLFFLLSFLNNGCICYLTYCGEHSKIWQDAGQAVLKMLDRARKLTFVHLSCQRRTCLVSEATCWYTSPVHWSAWCCVHADACNSHLDIWQIKGSL